MLDIFNKNGTKNSKICPFKFKIGPQSVKLVQKLATLGIISAHLNFSRFAMLNADIIDVCLYCLF